jgi:hypothetical protein
MTALHSRLFVVPKDTILGWVCSPRKDCTGVGSPLVVKQFGAQTALVEDSALCQKLQAGSDGDAQMTRCVKKRAG